MKLNAAHAMKLLLSRQAITEEDVLDKELVRKILQEASVGRLGLAYSIPLDRDRQLLTLLDRGFLVKTDFDSDTVDIRWGY